MIEISRIVNLIAQEKSFCLAAIVSSGSPAAPAGGKVILFADGTMEGSAGSPGLDRALRAAAALALADNESRTVEIAEGVRVFLDIIRAEARLLICGAGHIALSLSRFAREAGFSVTVLDDRPDFAQPSRFPGCRVLAEDFTAALRGMTFGPSLYAVVITRGHEHDAECLAEILAGETAYVGLIGSRRRGSAVLEALGRKGIPAARLNDVFTPIGLPIGAESPEEIALAIAAELVCIRRKGPLAARAQRAVSKGGK